jgi:hypothetical protein
LFFVNLYVKNDVKVKFRKALLAQIVAWESVDEDSRSDLIGWFSRDVSLARERGTKGLLASQFLLFLNEKIRERSLVLLPTLTHWI